MGEDDHVQLRQGIGIDDRVLEDLAGRHGIRRVSLYGSALRADFGPDSDVDLLLEFELGRTPGMLMIAGIELELEAVFGHPIKIHTYADLSRYFWDDAPANARQLSTA